MRLRVFFSLSLFAAGLNCQGQDSQTRNRLHLIEPFLPLDQPAKVISPKASKGMRLRSLIPAKMPAGKPCSHIIVKPANPDVDPKIRARIFRSDSADMPMVKGSPVCPEDVR